MGANISGVSLTLKGGTTVTGSTDSAGNKVFSGLTYYSGATLSWAKGTAGAIDWTAGSMSVNIDSTKTVNVALTPLYALQFEVGQANATVKVTGAVSETVNTDATLKATIYDVPVGSVSYTVTKDGFTTISDVYTVAQTTTVIYTIYAELQRSPKLELVTSGVQGKVLDSSYTYVSMLIVGRGGDYGNNTDSTGAGGGGGVIYAPNIRITDLPKINITFLTYTSVDDGGSTNFTCYKGQNGVHLNKKDGGQGGQAASVGTFSVVTAGGNGGGNGGGDGGGDRNPSGGGGSYANGFNVTGGKGGDGTFSHRGGGSAPGMPGTPANTTIIPLTSIFNGTGKGGDTSSNWTAGGGGGGGYGNGGNAVKGNYLPPGYGGGGAGVPNSEGGSNYGKGGAGIVCLYYHNDPI